MPLNDKYFIHYCRVAVSEGLNTDLITSELMLDKYNKELYQKCRYCHCVIEIKMAFKEEEDTCKKYLELQRNEDRINPQIYMIWTDNQKYRVFTNFIVHLQIVYSDMKISEISLVKLLMK